jgi:hypothetical protein
MKVCVHSSGEATAGEKRNALAPTGLVEDRVEVDHSLRNERRNRRGAIAQVSGLRHVFYVLHVVYVSTARNITLTLAEETLREARVLAAQRGLSVSAFLRLELAGLVERQRGFDRAKASAAKRLRRAHALGGGKLPTRDELHDRAKLR